MTNTEMLKQVIKESGLKLQSIANWLGISRFALQMKIENRHQFKSEEIQTLCRVLNIDSLEQKEAIFFAKEVDLKSIKEAQ